MMRPLCLSIVIAASALQLSACDNAAQDESAAAAARDSSLAYDLKLAAADTAPFSDAADVAMAQRSETASAADSIPMFSPPSARVASNGKSNSTVDESAGTAGASKASPRESRTSSSRPSPSPDVTAGSAATTPMRSSPSRPVREDTPAGSAHGPSAEAFAGPSCASPALADQRRCLLSYLARSDVKLDRNYQALITALKREAGTTERGKEPATVQRLRTSQRNWLVYRDDECRRRNEGKEGPLWAPTRAQCLAEYSDERAKELANALASRSSTSTSESNAASKKTKQTTSKSAKRTRG